ncbi:MAG: hypothetical protein HY928_13255 [Elusimicrobia bacterium]|nr:hypothetical protein [Elusimicrobiota bacterium]
MIDSAALRRRCEPVLRAWMRLAGALAELNAALVLSALWVLVFVPWGLVRVLAGVELLDLRFRDKAGYWRDRAPRPPESYNRLF